MKFLKYNQRLLICYSIKELLALRLLICYSIKELLALLLSKDFVKISSPVINNFNKLEKAKEKAFQLGKISANSKSYEFWVGVFYLYELFDKNCEFCFYLKDNFNKNKDLISSFLDLEKFKIDPPDIVIYYKEGLVEFELKRYRGNLTKQDLFDFINEKITKHYSDVYNFLIILQPKPYSKFSMKVFESLHNKLKKIKIKKLGKIVFSFNSNNKEQITVLIYPELEFIKRSFISWSVY